MGKLKKTITLGTKLAKHAAKTAVRRARGEGDPPMLDAGQKAPDFSVPNHVGDTVTLADLGGRYALLWFYPKADTPG